MAKRIRKGFVKKVLCFIVTVLRRHLCYHEICTSASNTCAVVVPPNWSPGYHFLKDTWEANVAKVVQILLVLCFGYAVRVSVDKSTSKF